jgi:predicted transcriptional regulator
MSGLTVENTVSDNEITILIDGKKMKMIKRYLQTKYGITFEDYKRIYNLPDDYPSCAPAYRSVRAGHAVTQGLGTGRVPRKRLKLATVNP